MYDDVTYICGWQMRPTGSWLLVGSTSIRYSHVCHAYVCPYMSLYVLTCVLREVYSILMCVLICPYMSLYVLICPHMHP